MARPLGHAPHTITLKLSRNICVGVYTSKNMNGLVSQHQRPKGTDVLRWRLHQQEYEWLDESAPAAQGHWFVG
jgi:hypothetical protein